MNYFGDYPTSATVRIPFATFASATGASITMTGFVVGDVKVYKNGGTTERSSTAGFTATTDFDALTGLHMLALDTSDNTDAGFWAAGNEYQVAVDAVTVDSQTVRFWVGCFSIERSGGALSYLKDATYGLSALETLMDDLESRLTAARAGYLDNLSAGAVALASGVILTTSGNAAVADKLLGRSIQGGADGTRTVTSALRKIRNRVAIAGGTMTVYQEDDSTTDHTAAVTTTAGNPITEVDPS